MIALLWGTLTAQAGPLAWKWDAAEPTRYHLEALLSTPTGLSFYGERNIDARATRTGMAIDTSCTSEARRKGWTVICAIDSVALEGVAYSDEQADLNTILGEYAAAWSGATVELDVRSDGHIRSLDLEGLSKENNRAALIHEYSRQIMRRAFAPLCLQLPREGADPGDGGIWKHKGRPLAFELPSRFGTSGGTAYSYEITGRQGDVVTISGFGRGNITSGASGGGVVSVGGEVAGTSSGLSLNMVVAGMARFDAVAGRALYSEVSATGEANASSVSVGDAMRYAYAGWAGWIHPDGVIEGREGPISKE